MPTTTDTTIRRQAPYLSGAVVLALLLVPTSVAADVLRPQNTATKEVGAVVDGVKDGVAVNDESYQLLDLGGFINALFPVIPLDNFLGGGHGEVIGFARDRPAVLVQDVAWTPGNNSIDLEFEDPYEITIRVWIVQGPYDEGVAAVDEGLLTAAAIWDDERFGVSFGQMPPYENATNDPDAGPLVDFKCGDDAAAIKTLIGYDPSRLNVYRVNTVELDQPGAVPSQGAGVWCSSEGIIAIGRFPSYHLLAHELGHAFTLGHTSITSFAPYFDSTNVMWTPSQDRRYLTEGQNFRAVFDPFSAVNNVYDVRPGAATRPCPHSTSAANADCPPVQKRVWADGTAWPPN